MGNEPTSTQDFREYLKTKKIDPEKFEEGDKAQYDQFKNLFNQIHPSSFTQQKLFLINKIRRKYILEEVKEEVQPTSPKKLKPKVLPKPKLS